MENLNLFTISSLLVVITNCFQTVFITLKGDKNKHHILWALMCLCGAWWGWGSYNFATTSQYEEAFHWWQLSYIAVILAPPTFTHFTASFLNLNSRILLRIIYPCAIFFLILNFYFPELFLADLRIIYTDIFWHDWQANKSPLFAVFFLIYYCMLLPYTFFLIVKKFYLAKGLERQQLKYLIVGSLCAWISPFQFFLIDFGAPFYPSFQMLLVIFPTIITYAIMRHELFNIKIVIKRGLVYTLIISSVTLIYFAVVYCIEKLFQDAFGYQSLVTSIIFATIIAVAFIPLRNLIQNFIDKLLLKGSAVEIAEQNESLKERILCQEKFRIMAGLSSGLAHEIKNPLTSIKTFAQHLPDKANDPEFVQKFSTIVNTEVERINDLVHQLLDFAKPNPPQFQPVDIEKLLTDILQFLNNDLLKHHITLKTDFQLGAQRTINADPNQLRQAFLNLLLNAIEAMPGGGVLTISASRTTNPEARITISDTGPGIDPKDLPKIFEPFYSKKEKGTGLGLAITKTIIEQHGGKIRVESGIEKGARFHITLSFISSHCEE